MKIIVNNWITHFFCITSNLRYSTLCWTCCDYASLLFSLFILFWSQQAFMTNFLFLNKTKIKLLVSLILHFSCNYLFTFVRELVIRWCAIISFSLLNTFNSQHTWVFDNFKFYSVVRVCNNQSLILWRPSFICLQQYGIVEKLNLAVIYLVFLAEYIILLQQNISFERWRFHAGNALKSVFVALLEFIIYPFHLRPGKEYVKFCWTTGQNVIVITITYYRRIYQ